MWTDAVSRSRPGNHGAAASFTSSPTMVSNTDSTICASSPGRISTLDSVAIFISQVCVQGLRSAGDINNGAADRLSLKPLVNAERGFGPAQQEPTAPEQGSMEFPQNTFPRFHVEVDHYVAAEHQIERSQRAHAAAQVDRVEASHFANGVVQLPVDAGAAEILDQKRGRQAPVHLDLLEFARAGALQNRRGKIGAENLNIPVLISLFEKAHGEAVGFLPGRRRGRPEA